MEISLGVWILDFKSDTVEHACCDSVNFEATGTVCTGLYAPFMYLPTIVPYNDKSGVLKEVYSAIPLRNVIYDFTLGLAHSTVSWKRLEEENCFGYRLVSGKDGIDRLLIFMIIEGGEQIVAKAKWFPATEVIPAGWRIKVGHARRRESY